jgi:hypothetical protein
VIRLAAESIGLGKAAEIYGASLFGQGARPGGILEHPAQLSDQARENLRSSFEGLHKGPANANRMAILEEGMTWRQVAIPPEDAQFLQTREFQVIEIARWFNVPPHFLRDLSRATFSNIEHQGIEFVIYSLRPWLVRWEQEVNRKLLSPAERKGYFAEFLVDALLRGDIATRYESYATARNNGWLSADEIRSMENQNPLPDGTGARYYMPANMLEVRAVEQGEQQDVQSAALNGAQVGALTDICLNVSNGNFTPEAATAIIDAAFPLLTIEEIQSITSKLEKVTDGANGTSADGIANPGGRSGTPGSDGDQA